MRIRNHDCQSYIIYWTINLLAQVLLFKAAHELSFSRNVLLCLIGGELHYPFHMMICQGTQKIFSERLAAHVILFETGCN